MCGDWCTGLGECFLYPMKPTVGELVWRKTGVAARTYRNEIDLTDTEERTWPDWTKYTVNSRFGYGGFYVLSERKTTTPSSRLYL